MNILHKALTLTFLCLEILSDSVSVAGTIDYPLYTFHSSLSEPYGGRKVAEEAQLGELRREKIYQELETHNSSVTGAIKLKLKYETRKNLSDYKDVKIQAKNYWSTERGGSFTASKTDPFTLDPSDTRRFESLLLYYTTKSLLDCRPKFKAVFEGEAISKQLPRAVETDLGVYSSVSAFELITSDAIEKSITFFQQKYLTSTIGTEWWKTEKEGLTVYQKMLRVPLYGKSNISIRSDGEIQQINVIASIRGKGEKLLEYPITKKDVFDGNSIISIDLHSKLIVFDRSLDDFGYTESNNDITNAEDTSKSVPESANSKVIIKEIIVNFLPSAVERQSAIFSIETQGRVANDFEKKYVSTVSSNYEEDHNGYKILEIPLEKIRKYAGLRTGRAHFEGFLPTLENEICEFSPLKLVFVNYQTYKYPLAAKNEWSDSLQRTLPYIDQYSKVKASAANISEYRSVAITRPKPQGNVNEDTSHQVVIDLWNGSLRAVGRNLKSEVDIKGTVLTLTADNIRMVKVRANVPKSVDGDLLISVRSIGLCGSTRYYVQLYSGNKLASEAFGYANRILQVKGTKTRITEYVVTFIPENSAATCTTFKLYNTAVEQLSPNFDRSYQTRDYISALKREAIVLSTASNLSSYGLLGTKEHYYQIINNNTPMYLSVILPSHLFYFDELLLIGRDLRDIAGACANVQLQLQFEHGSTFSHSNSSIPDPSGCRFPINLAPETDNKMGKLMRVQIKLPDVEWDRISSLRAEIKGLYETSIIEKLLGAEFGVINTYKVNLPLTESISELTYDKKIDPFSLMIKLPANIIKILIEPGNFFLPRNSDYFSVYEVVAIVDNETIATKLQAWLDVVQLKKPFWNKFIIIVLVVLCCFLYVLRNKLANYFVLPVKYTKLNSYSAYLGGVQPSTWLLLLYCTASVLFTLISFIFSAKDVALSLTTSSLMMYSLYRFISEAQTGQSLSPTQTRTNTPLYGFIVVLLFQLTTYFFVGRILAIDLNLQCMSLPIYTLVSCIGCARYYTSAEISFKNVNRYVSFTMISILMLVGWAITSRISYHHLFLSIVWGVGVILGSFLRLHSSVSVFFSSLCITWIASTLFFNLKMTGLHEVLSVMIFGGMVSLVIPFKKGSSVRTRLVL